MMGCDTAIRSPAGWFRSGEMVKIRHPRTESDNAMTFASHFLAASDWTLSVNWCSAILEFGLLNLVAFLILAVPLLLIAWMFFRMRAVESAVLAGGAAASSRLDPQLGFVYDAAPSDQDNLEEINGVAAVLEGKLHAFGVFKFRQIAGWSDEVAREFGHRLAFSDRVIREEWREQAAKLHAAKHGGAA